MFQGINIRVSTFLFWIVTASKPIIIQILPVFFSSKCIPYTSSYSALQARHLPSLTACNLLSLAWCITIGKSLVPPVDFIACHFQNNSLKNIISYIAVSISYRFSVVTITHKKSIVFTFPFIDCLLPVFKQ